MIGRRPIDQTMYLCMHKMAMKLHETRGYSVNGMDVNGDLNTTSRYLNNFDMWCGTVIDGYI